MKPFARHLFRAGLIATVSGLSLQPHFVARWLIHHETLYYQIGGSGRLGNCITFLAEILNDLTPFPFVFIGLVLGFGLVDQLSERWIGPRKSP